MADITELSTEELLSLADTFNAQNDISALSDEKLMELQAGMPPKESPLWGASDQLASGYLQGMGDELKAGVAAAKESLGGGLPFGDAYSQAKTQYQGARDDYRAAHPVLAPTLEVGGAMAPWVLSAGLLPPVAAGASMPAKMWESAKIAAPIGGMASTLMAEGDIGDRADASLVGGALGGALGLAAPPVVAVVVGAGKSLINQVVSRFPQQQRSVAARKIAEALARDGFTPDQAAAKLQEMGPNASILDLGANTRALAGTAQQTPGQGKTAITDFLVNRQEGVRGADKVLQGGQVERITNQIDDLVPEQYADTEAAILAARKGFGKNYNAARDGGDLVDVEPLIKNLVDEIEVSKGGIKASLQKVHDLLIDAKGHPEVTIDSLHQAKMAIDDLMSGEARMSMGNVAKGRIRDYTNALIDAIEGSGESGAAYNAGRVGTRGEWMKQEALESGVNFMNKSEFVNPETLKASLAKMSPEELHTFRVGAAQALKQKIGDLVNRADATKKIMDIPSLEKKIRAAFGDDELFKRYITGLEGEKEMFKGYSMMGGSQTAERLAAKADSVIDPSRIIQGLTQMNSPNPLNWIGGGLKIAGGAKDRLLMPEGMSKALGDTMTGRSVASLQAPYRAQGLNKEMIAALSRYLSAGGAAGQNTMNNALGAR